MKNQNSEMRSKFQQIVLYCLDLCTQNTRLWELDLESSHNRGTDKINMLKQGRNNQKKASLVVHLGLTYGVQDLEM